MDSEAGVVVGPEFGEEGGVGEVVEGVKAGGGAHCADGGWRELEVHMAGSLCDRVIRMLTRLRVPHKCQDIVTFDQRIILKTGWIPSMNGSQS